MVPKTASFLLVAVATVASCSRIPGRTDDHESITTPQKPKVPSGIIKAIKAEWPSCRLENHIVELVPEEPGVTFSPNCVSVGRCVGCNRNPHLTCKPSRTELAIYQVTKHKHGSTDTPFYVNVTKHVQCEDQCRLTQQDCSVRQTYHEGDCACKCNNTREEMQACEADGKEWDSDSCTCSCRTKDCDTGEIFSHDSCECEAEEYD